MKYLFVFLLVGLTFNSFGQIKKQYYNNGKLKSEINYKDGAFDGLYREWYENGKLKSEGHYVSAPLLYQDGEYKIGIHSYWDKNGQLLEQTKYGMDDRQEILFHRVWRENGQLKKEEILNENVRLYKRWYDNGQLSYEVEQAWRIKEILEVVEVEEVEILEVEEEVVVVVTPAEVIPADETPADKALRMLHNAEEAEEQARLHQGRIDNRRRLNEKLEKIKAEEVIKNENIIKNRDIISQKCFDKDGNKKVCPNRGSYIYFYYRDLTDSSWEEDYLNSANKE